MILQQLNTIVPPRTVLRAFARVDPFPSIAGPAPPTTPPDTRALASAAVRRARPSVVRITATACGLGVEGSGWVARPHLVVTAAHVVEGAHGHRGGRPRRAALVVDRKQDVAVLRVPGLRCGAAPDRRRPLAATRWRSSAIPENGPFDARAGRMGHDRRRARAAARCAR